LLALLTAPADETKSIVSSVECEVKNNQLRAWPRSISFRCNAPLRMVLSEVWQL
jgi:hypothetical protein